MIRYSFIVLILFLPIIGKGQHFSDEFPTLVVLGTIQDAGSPHPGCQKACCEQLFQIPDPYRLRTCLGLIDPVDQKKYLIEATPDLPVQMEKLHTLTNYESGHIPDGIFLTHAHIGHYTGLMYLGREGLNTLGVKVYVMPAMEQYLEENGPWSQLVELGNIELVSIKADKPVKLRKELKVTSFLVPHRDEFSETVGFLIEGPNSKAVFIPDIDKWEKWDRSIISLLDEVDYAFLDATFYSTEEVIHRDISEIPHPLMIETMKLFENAATEVKNKIHFIHFNHTNPILDQQSAAFKELTDAGFRICSLYDNFEL